MQTYSTCTSMRTNVLTCSPTGLAIPSRHGILLQDPAPSSLPPERPCQTAGLQSTADHVSHKQRTTESFRTQQLLPQLMCTGTHTMYIHILGWNSSKPDTIGPEESVLISGVALFSGVEKHTNMVLGEEELSLFQWCPYRGIVYTVYCAGNCATVYTCTLFYTLDM